MGLKVVEHLLSQVECVVVCSPTFHLQNTWDPIRKRVDLYADSLYNITKVLLKYINSLEGKSCLIVLDDVSSERSLNEGSVGVLNQLAYNAIWMNVSMVVICHRYSNLGGGIRENVEHLLIFQTITNDQLKVLSENFSITGNKKDFIEIYKQIVVRPILEGKDEYPFLYICFKGGVKVYDKFLTQLLLT